MEKASLRLLGPDDAETASLVAEWYNREWNLPQQGTLEQLQSVCTGGTQFQAVLSANGRPVATGGVYHHAAICDREPRFRQYRHWLALVYTLPEFRNRGYGALLCEYLQETCRCKGVDNLYLFTGTAERLYSRLGWGVMERLETGGKRIVVMQLRLAGAADT